MTDTTTQAALSRMIERVTSDPDGPYASALIASCEPLTIIKLCQALASLTAERDGLQAQVEALRAQLRASDARLFEVRDLLNHRPALNAGTLEAYIRWTNEVVKLDWLNAIDDARKEGD